ncbi:MAG: protoheme IX farnesyltransferase [Desulfuromonadales bacterium]|nr:protoheme IX farnesyltransferase [Desulfuromonadales bacterium]
MRFSLLHIQGSFGATLPEQLSLMLQLSRGRLSALVALSGLTGYLFALHRWDPQALQTGVAILLLSAGCSALNQWQEREIDARMERTRLRPLPTGRLSPRQVLTLALLMLSAGLLLLALLPSWSPLLLGALAIFWYNGVYTGLKRVTAYAVLPGALCGSLPPLIGWCAAGGEPTAFPAVVLAGTLFLWQMPHFWLLACCHRDDHRQSGLPNLFRQFDHQRLFRINNCWLLALGISYLLFPLFGLLRGATLGYLYLIALSGLILAVYSELHKGACSVSHRKLFNMINCSMLLLLATLLIDSL